MSDTTKALALYVGAIVVAVLAMLGLGLSAQSSHGHYLTPVEGTSVPAVPQSGYSTQVFAEVVGDDNNDGIIDEDESGWNCATMGNKTCGSDQGANVLPGDDNADGVIDEDESGWNCATMGNKICG